MSYGQFSFDIRCEWGLWGVRLVGKPTDVVIIVDALSFSTCVEIAVSRGATIFPYRWKQEGAREYARELNAELAVPRGQPGGFSLSPVSMLRAFEGTRIVLPSPNGSELTAEAQSLGCTVVAGCFRNCQAVARYAMTQGRTITVIPCGERWPDGTLRPAAEDLAAAGAIIANLSGTVSQEASVATEAWASAEKDVIGFLKSCASGRELIDRGFETDVELAGQVNVGDTVPSVRQRAYVALRADESL
jgi:2-phosphosulfolactate phosphatase